MAGCSWGFFGANGETRRGRPFFNRTGGDQVYDGISKPKLGLMSGGPRVAALRSVSAAPVAAPGNPQGGLDPRREGVGKKQSAKPNAYPDKHPVAAVRLERRVGTFFPGDVSGSERLCPPGMV